MPTSDISQLSVSDCGFSDPPTNVHAGSTTVNNGGEKRGSFKHYWGKTWHIKDYKGSDIDVKCSSLGHMPFMEIWSAFRLHAAKSQRPTFTAEPADNSIKHILLKGRFLMANDAMLLSTRNKVRENADAAGGSTHQKSTSATLFGKFRKDSDVSTSHKLNEYHCSG
jgi:hypothetical protein